MSAEMSPSGSEHSPYNDRKKQTHLRCERQRREAINNGYSELKELIPQSTSALGCKTTNAAILFRACDYITQLEADVKAGDKNLQMLHSQVSAMEMIVSEYETMSAEAPSSTTSVQQQMLQTLLDDCFRSFANQVDFDNYGTITRTLLTWVESLAATNGESFKKTVSTMVTLPYQQD